MLKILIDATARTDKLIKLIEKSVNQENTLEEVAGDVDLVITIQLLLKNNNLQLNDIHSFEYKDGQGSFTGLKMAAAVANVLQWSVNNVPSEKLKMPTYGSEPNIQSPH